MTRQRAMLWIGVVSISVVLPTLVSAPSLAVDDVAETAAPVKPRGRLPNHFGKLEVSAQQRQRIYEIQADYDGRIDDLLTRIEQLRTERNTAVAAVLTPEQRQKLASLREEQAAKRKAKSDAKDN